MVLLTDKQTEAQGGEAMENLGLEQKEPWNRVTHWGLPLGHQATLSKCPPFSGPQFLHLRKEELERGDRSSRFPPFPRLAASDNTSKGENIGKTP